MCSSSLSAVDQTKIHLAIQLRRIDVADIPDSAKPKRPPGVSLSQTSHNKRKAIEESPQASTSRATVTQPLVDPQTEAIEEGSQENEIVDELYCTMRTNVVGIQYYEGRNSPPTHFLPWLNSGKGLVAPGEEVVLTRDPRNPYDSCVVFGYHFAKCQLVTEMPSRSRTLAKSKSDIYLVMSHPNLRRFSIENSSPSKG